jgi:hypothetical protein
MMNLPPVRHLRHLTALYDHGHFGRAAEACHVTQSTLSASIKELESVLQVNLDAVEVIRFASCSCTAANGGLHLPLNEDRKREGECRALTVLPPCSLRAARADSGR